MPRPTHVDDAAGVSVQLVASLDQGQREQLLGRLDDPDLTTWTYLPGPRPGLSMEGLNPQQRELVLSLLRAVHSPRGGELAIGAIAVERVRRELVTGAAVDHDRYWLRLLGDPEGEEPWGWRINGHHLAVHAITVDGRMTLTPHFVGSEPATVPTGDRAGMRLLAIEEDLARTLVTSLDDERRQVAVVSTDAPDDILTRDDPVADPSVLPVGIARGDLGSEHQGLLDRLVRHYLDRAPAAYADACWREAEQDGLDAITFAWLGDLQLGGLHYYCVRAPGFLIEYDNTQDDGNHAHSVWRHLRDDWGGDALAEHYRRGHALR